MAQLNTKVKLYLEDNSKTEEELFNGNIQLENIGAGDYIKVWNVSGVTKPTDEQLNALESEADTLESNYQVINTRKNLYGTTAEQLEYIVENGVDAFVAKQNQIKSENPKT
jgi:hypothetical protein